MLRIHWFLPTGGDSADVVPTSNSTVRAPGHDYLAQVATACDSLGFDGLLTPCGTACEDAWVATASLIPLTRRIRFLVAFRPGLLSPTLAAQMASTYQRMSGGRLLLNVVTGAEPSELARFGDFADKATRYERTAEFIDVMSAAWGPEPIDHKGTHFDVRGSTTRAVPDPRPDIYFGGASAEAEAVAAARVDVYLAWGEPPDMLRSRLERMRALAAASDRSEDRPLRFGVRFHVISRDTSDEAWAAADRLLEGMDPTDVEAARNDFAATRSEGQRRMASLSGGRQDAAASTNGATNEPARIPTDPRELEIHPNVWSGIGLVRGGAGTALVGSHVEVADRIEEYAALGISEFIFSGYPHLEEAYLVGEGLLPELRRRLLIEGGDDHPATAVSTFR